MLLGGANGAMALAGNAARLAQGHLQWRAMADGLRVAATPLVVVPSDDSHFHITVANRLDRLGVPARPGRQRDCARLLMRYRSNILTAPMICVARSG